ncbi:sodium:proton antiporter [Silicimonas algicola]|uniref:Sodium/proton antiporter (CPA1 family) n=1 Tax=Silicimonas algicola TaxID=1826607 RepID=A0A316GDH8_9RHOB|nr:sodium:proton antiporter [Silicimonas algicola]AZQ66703.1 sodium:proton antiporter [Silicimonas algicola]PWK59059.1 sodium/proton antiporter (CPA1 family) [Silicimonas algicola]
MNTFNIVVTLLGGVTLLLALVSDWLSRSPFPPTLLALLIGVLLGPEALGLIDLETMGDRGAIMEKAARLTLGIGLVGVALRIPRSFPRKNWRDLFLLIVPGMILMWAISTALVYLILGLPFWMAALIGAIITPTDPVAASPIVTGKLAEKNIPESLRHSMSFESGANDGLGYLFVFLPFLLLSRSPGEALSHWLTKSLLWDVGVATLLGLVLGYVAARLLQISERRGAIKSEWRLVYTVALALFAVGIGRLIRSDEVLLVFAAGAMFTQVISREDRQNEEHGQEAVNRFFAIPIFILLGTALPWQGWQEMGWQGPILVATVLLLRRPPVLLVLRPFLRNLRTPSEALFMGWFGPIAVAAIYYSSLMEHRAGEPIIWHATSLVVCGSVIAHGLTGAPLTKALGHWLRERRSQSADRSESKGAAAPILENMRS